MFKKLLLAIVLTSFSSCGLLFNSGLKPVPRGMPIRFSELNYGVFKSENIKYNLDKNSPTGKTAEGDSIYLTSRTTHIPCSLGTEFGIEYIVKTYKDFYADMESEWEFPSEMTNEAGIKFRKIKSPVRVYTNFSNFTTYILEKPFELLPGKWTLRLFYHGNKIYEKVFELK